MSGKLAPSTQDDHLKQAVDTAFDNVALTTEDLADALLAHCKQASTDAHRRALSRLHTRLEHMLEYWQQLHEDSKASVSNTRENVKSFIEVVRDTGYHHGHQAGREEQISNVYDDGFAEGFTQGDKSNHKPVLHGAVGFGICLIVVLILHMFIPH